MRFVIVLCCLIVLSGCGSPQQTTSSSETESQLPVDEKAMAAKARTPSQSMDENFIAQGVEHLQDADTLGAIRNFDEYIKRHPQDPRGYIILGQTYMRLNDYPRAIDTFSAATRVAPDQGDLYYFLAMNYGLNNNLDMAIASAQKSVVLFREQKDEENFLRSLALLQGLMNARDEGTDAPAQAAPTTP